MITPSLQEKIGVAMKAHDEVRVSTLRLLLSAFNYEQIAKQHELTEEEELAVIRREAKKRKEAIEMYKNAGAVNRAAKEAAELEILAEYLPPDMSDEELVKLVADAIIQIKPSGMADMGKVIGLVKSRAPDADGGKIAQLVKEKLG